MHFQSGLFIFIAEWTGVAPASPHKACNAGSNPVIPTYKIIKADIARKEDNLRCLQY